MTSKKEIAEKIANLEYEFRAFNSKVEKLLVNVGQLASESFFERLELINESFRESRATLKDAHLEASKNLNRLNMMTNELKGVVAMARASLEEGRKFTELVEMPNLCRKLSEDVQKNESASYRFSEEIRRLEVLKDNLTFLLHPCTHKVKKDEDCQ